RVRPRGPVLARLSLLFIDFHPDHRVLYIIRSIAQDGRSIPEKDTKGRQRRHIALDPDTAALLVAYRRYRERLAADHGLTLPADGFIFSPTPDGSRCLVPSALGQRLTPLNAPSDAVRTAALDHGYALI